MTSTASNVALRRHRGLEVVGPERVGQHLVIVWMPETVSSSSSGRVLVQQLPAAAARHEHVAVAVDAGEGDELAAAGHVQLADERALGAQRHAVRGVLDVAADDDPSVVDERGGAHREVRVRRVGAPVHRLDAAARSASQSMSVARVIP